jgi:para-aminobenzoate synthetase / 4-amino-4-deoxychorismate lyase
LAEPIQAIVDFPGMGGPLVFGAPSDTVVARELREVLPALRRVEELSAAGRWCVGYVAYEAAPAFEPAARVREPDPRLPLVWFSVHERPGPLSAIDERRDRSPTDGVPVGNSAIPTASGSGEDSNARLSSSWVPDTGTGEFSAALAEIHEGIARGDYYQVNFTIRFHADGAVDARGLYERLRRVQPRSYAALIDTGDFQVVSASPELFFALDGRRLTMRPMKGTARRGRWSAEDDDAAARLQSSVKERAENVMIVDLIRNDAGRISRTGSVRVPALFEVERHPTVLQMTSTVEATLRDAVSLAGVFAALFPCGSVTGAPKIAAMNTIARLERSPRGVYCGAIGVVEPGGNARFSVAIRTAVVDARSMRAEYGAGGGITWDSDPGAERNEVFAKAAILTGDRPPFALVETMLLADGEVRRSEGHLQRMTESAAYFGFEDPGRGARERLEIARGQHPAGEWRLRLEADAAGMVSAIATPLDSLPDERPALVSRLPVDAADPFLFHKTTRREVYDSRGAEHPGCFDVILANEAGELTEFTIGNLVVELDGQRWTPPVECGLLPGVFRGELLRSGEIAERVLRPDDLAAAAAVWRISSLRGWVRVTVDPAASCRAGG